MRQVLRSPCRTSSGVPLHGHQRRTGPPTAAELVGVLKAQMFLAGHRPGWEDFLRTKGALDNLFSRGGAFDPESRDAALTLYRKAVGL